MLEVHSEKADPAKHGTLVEMTSLKQQVYPKIIGKRLAKRLTARPDLQIEVNGEQLKNDKVSGKEIKIDEDHPKLGHIKGTLLYSDDPDYEDAGVHIRVYGRMVNANPRLLRSIYNVSGAMTLTQRTFLDVNIDALAPAVLAHRNGFNEDHPLVGELEKWVKTRLNSENAAYLRDRRDETDKLQEAKVLVTLSKRLSGVKMAMSVPGKSKSQIMPGRKRIRNRAEALKEADDIIAKKDELELEFKDKKFAFDLASLGENGDAWTFDEKKRSVRINSEHPLFKEAKGRKSQDLYALETAIVAIAFHTSSKHDEFKKNYEELARTAVKKL